MPPIVLNQTSFDVAIQQLCKQDKGLAEIVDTVGAPPFWIRPAGFSTLIQIILEQQVSLASALATFKRLNDLAGELTPERMLELDDLSLRRAGFSRQKTRYSRIAARAVISGTLNLDGLADMEDNAARAALTALTGIGPWTADVYLQMALRRPDVWPIGDVALQEAVKRYADLPARPRGDEMEQHGEKWRPLRTVAASILWHGYLNLPYDAYR
jgi:DNA-3-methyladenine glycosylase II